MLSAKPAKCPHCKQRVEPVGKRIHPECVDSWWAANKEKIKVKADKALEKKRKLEKKKDKEKLKQMRHINKFHEDAKESFNAYIRYRDKDMPCICCGEPLGSGDVGGAYDCGHYRSVGSARHLRYHEDNAHAQRKYCNDHLSGNHVNYRIGLIQRIGLERVEALESNNAIHKWTREELIEITQRYRCKLRQLKRESNPLE